LAQFGEPLFSPLTQLSSISEAIGCDANKNKDSFEAPVSQDCPNGSGSERDKGSRSSTGKLILERASCSMMLKVSSEPRMGLGLFFIFR
jgi:hypothetical protein